jgi:hypothetical protein
LEEVFDIVYGSKVGGFKCDAGYFYSLPPDNWLRWRFSRLRRRFGDEKEIIKAGRVSGERNDFKVRRKANA